MTDRMEEIKARWAAVPDGPWGWFGSPYSGFYLATNHSGREYVMGFARLGMNDAQPLFRRGNVMVKARDLCIYEVNKDATDINDPSLYRHDIVGFRSPCADAIKAAPEDVRYLLEEFHRVGDCFRSAADQRDTALDAQANAQDRIASLESLVRKLAKVLRKVEDFDQEGPGLYVRKTINHPDDFDENAACEDLCVLMEEVSHALSMPLVSELTVEKEGGE